jgi:Fe-S-cluster-containing hydrogenase component 2
VGRAESGGRAAGRLTLIRRTKAKQDAVLLVCTKCFKKADVKDRLTKPLKRAVKPLGYKLVKTRCLGVCPKNAVTMNDSRRPREWMIVKPDATAETVAASLLDTVGERGLS